MGLKLIFLIVTRAVSVLGLSRREAWWKDAAAFIDGIADALVGGASLAVDAVGVDLEQDGDAVPARRATSVAGTPAGTTALTGGVLRGFPGRDTQIPAAEARDLADRAQRRTIIRRGT